MRIVSLSPLFRVVLPLALLLGLTDGFGVKILARVTLAATKSRHQSRVDAAFQISARARAMALRAVSAVSSSPTTEGRGVREGYGPAPRPLKRAARGDVVFTRTNRVRGQQRWENELRNFIAAARDLRLQRFAATSDSAPTDLEAQRSLAGDADYSSFYQRRVEVLTQLSKELLYSGIPEQVVQLYVAYQDSLPHIHPESDASPANSSDSVDAGAFAPDLKLVMVTARAFVALSDVDGALKLLRSCARAGTDLNPDYKTQLMAELAEHSAEGLQAALQLRLSMLQRGEPIGIGGAVGVLRGVWMHGMKDVNELIAGAASHGDNELLVDSTMRSEVLAKERSARFQLSAVAADALAYKIAQQYIIPPQQRHQSKQGVLRAGASKRSHGIVRELLRVAFRAAAMQHRMPRSKGPTVDIAADRMRERESRTIAGLRGAMAVMSSFGIEWDQHVADVLIDECFRVGDITGVHCVVHHMTARDINSSTATFNALLRRYAESGDAESAYLLVNKIMSSGASTAADSESYELLLRACLKTKRGRYLGKLVMADLLEKDSAVAVAVAKTKSIWDALLELTVKTDGNYLTTLVLMISDNVQPDCRTMSALYTALCRHHGLETAMRLYTLQKCSDECRSQCIAANQNQTAVSESHACAELSPLERRLSSLLPPPSPVSLKTLLRLLRDARQHQLARQVLGDIMARARSFHRAGGANSSNAAAAEAAETAAAAAAARVEVSPTAISESAKALLFAQFAPDCEMFALVMEASLHDGENHHLHVDSAIASNDTSGGDLLSSREQLEMVLELVAQLEEWGLTPDRRIYANIIAAFGQNDDPLSALGVFQEMRQKFYPDVASLQSILDVCMGDPTDLRQVCGVLEELAEQEHVDLDVYANDLLMQSFDDAHALGACLEAMEAQEVPEDCECVEVSLQVLSVLVQAVRTTEGVAGIASALLFLGAAGIRLDGETMDYFRIQPGPAMHSPNSRHYHRSFLPQRRKRPSILDSELPSELQPDLSLPASRFRSLIEKRRPLRVPIDRPQPVDEAEPYFESGRDEWWEHSGLLQQIMEGREASNEESDEFDIHIDFLKQVRPAEGRRATNSTVLVQRKDRVSVDAPSLAGARAVDSFAQEAAGASDDDVNVNDGDGDGEAMRTEVGKGKQPGARRSRSTRWRSPLPEAQGLLRGLKVDGSSHTVIIGSLDAGMFISPSARNRDELMKLRDADLQQQMAPRVDTAEDNDHLDEQLDDFAGEGEDESDLYIQVNSKVESYDENKHYVPSVSIELLSSWSTSELRSVLQMSSDNAAISKDMQKMKARLRDKSSGGKSTGKDKKRGKGPKGRPAPKK